MTAETQAPAPKQSGICSNCMCRHGITKRRKTVESHQDRGFHCPGSGLLPVANTVRDVNPKRVAAGTKGGQARAAQIKHFGGSPQVPYWNRRAEGDNGQSSE